MQLKKSPEIKEQRKLMEFVFAITIKIAVSYCPQGYIPPKVMIARREEYSTFS
jgi:hypothetical protein